MFRVRPGRWQAGQDDLFKGYTVQPDSKADVYTFHLTGDGLFAADVAGKSLDDVSQHLPAGTYTTLRTFGKQGVLRLGAHLDRLEESARVLGRTLKLDRDRLAPALADVLDRTGFPESRLRVTVPLNAHGSPDIYITIESFKGIDPELYETGVRVATMLIARASPRAKSTGFIVPSRNLKAGLPREIYEVLMVTGDGQILEGFTSNFFAFVEGRLVTAQAGVLEGITRSIVLELAEALFRIERRAPCLAELRQVDEAFITSSSRGVLPVVVVNEQVIGDGRPGPLTRRLRRRYDEYVVEAARPAA